MAWLFEPKNNECIDCKRTIVIHSERHYIVYDGRRKERCYRRECADCHDALIGRSLGRKRSTDAIAFGTSREGT